MSKICDQSGNPLGRPVMHYLIRAGKPMAERQQAEGIPCDPKSFYVGLAVRGREMRLEPVWGSRKDAARIHAISKRQAELIFAGRIDARTVPANHVPMPIDVEVVPVYRRAFVLRVGGVMGGLYGEEYIGGVWLSHDMKTYVDYGDQIGVWSRREAQQIARDVMLQTHQPVIVPYQKDRKTQANIEASRKKQARVKLAVKPLVPELSHKEAVHVLRVHTGVSSSKYMDIRSHTKSMVAPTRWVHAHFDPPVCLLRGDAGFFSMQDAPFTGKPANGLLIDSAHFTFADALQVVQGHIWHRGKANASIAVRISKGKWAPAAGANWVILAIDTGSYVIDPHTGAAGGLKGRAVRMSWPNIIEFMEKKQRGLLRLMRPKVRVEVRYANYAVGHEPMEWPPGVVHPAL